MNLTPQQIGKIKSVITDKVHGQEFYTKQMYQATVEEVDKLVKSLGITKDMPHVEIVKRVNEYIISIYSSRPEYFDAWLNGVPQQKPEELKYRTAYAALKEKQATCFGYEQATRMLLECGGIKTHTVMSKMAEDWRTITHYASVAELDNNGRKKMIIVDSERDSFCRKHGLSFDEYIEGSLYFLPTEINIERKLDNGGVGPLIKQSLEAGPKYVKGQRNLETIIGVTSEQIKG